MKEVQTDIPVNYRTIRVTDSRIKKGLLAIPRSLADLFPSDKRFVTLVDIDNNENKNSFTPYSSSTHESRIGGLSNFFKIYQIKDGDEVVIQKNDEGKYRLLPEHLFHTKVLDAFNQFEKSTNDTDIESSIDKIVKVSNEARKVILQNEFVRLVNINELLERKRSPKKSIESRETVPLYIRKILSEIYEGKCQLTNFSFIQKNGSPYFEIHHILPYKGDYLKNLLVVSPNIHAQFTYADVEHSFDENGWLRRVKFNDIYFSVFQIIDKLQRDFIKEVHFIN